MDAHRVDVLHVADGDAVVRAVAHHLVLDLFPADQRLLDQYLRDGTRCEAASDDLVELIDGIGDAATGAAQRVCGPYDQRQTDVVHDPVGVFHGLCYLRRGHRLSDAHQQVSEQLAVLGVAYSLKRSAEQSHIVLVQDAGVGKLHCEVEAGLTSERRQQPVGALLVNDPVQYLDGQGLDVDDIGDVLIGHDRRRVRVHEDGSDAFLSQRLARLRACVVELRSLANDDRPRADNKYFSRFFLNGPTSSLA